ncbi:Uncharacterised protein [Mycobacteroides abscessus subsp. abscessus]|nr:Uncharacterised protein [Mycobacteroides abscessus subsp. abscessus]
MSARAGQLVAVVHLQLVLAVQVPMARNTKATKRSAVYKTSCLTTPKPLSLFSAPQKKNPAKTPAKIKATPR